MDPVQLGLRIRKVREARRPKMTQEDLARAVDRKLLTISNIERGITADPKVETLAAIARVLEVKLEWLMEGDDAPQVTLERSSADEAPTGQEEDIAWASASVGLTEAETQRLTAVRRSIGPMTRAELFSSAESIMRNRPTGKASLPFNAAADRARLDVVVDPEGDAAPTLAKPKKR